MIICDYLMRKKVLSGWIIVVIALLLNSTQVLAASADPEQLMPDSSVQVQQKRSEFVVILSVPGISFMELSTDMLQQMPNLKFLSENSAVAALNVRTPEKGIEDVYLTINSGAPAMAPAEVQAFHIQSVAIPDAKQRYMRYTGRQPALADIVVPEIGYLTTLNESLTYDARIGRLGDVLSDQKVHTVVFGAWKDRNHSQVTAGHAPLMLMTSEGTLTSGDMGSNMLIHDPESPDGYRTNTEQILDLVYRLISEQERLRSGQERLISDQDHLISEQDRLRSGQESLITDQDCLISEQDSIPFADPVQENPERSEDNNQLRPRTNSGQLVKDRAKDTAVSTAIDSLVDATESEGNPVVVLIEFSDWLRLDQERRNYEPEQWYRSRSQILHRLDEFVGELTSLLHLESQSRGQLWFLSPLPHSIAARAKWHVTPFFIYDPGENTPTAEQRYIGKPSSSLLTSPTTRRAGLVSLHDLGPTLLDVLGIEDGERWTGFPVVSAPHPDAWQWLLQDVNKMRNVYELRINVVIPFVTYEVIVLLLGLLIVLLKRRQALRWMRVPLLSLLVSPFFLLLLGMVPHFESDVQLLVFLVSVILASVCCSKWLSVESGIFIVALATAVVLMLDGLFGARLIRYSIMGYDPMIGARYYGIGNEYMGVLVGCVVLAAALAVQWIGGRITVSRSASRSRKASRKRPGSWWGIILAVSIGFTLVTLYLAHPNGGTNAGGALTASAAFGLAWIRMFGSSRMRQISLLRLVIIVGGLLVAGLTILWAMNQWLVQSDAASQSHIGRAMGFFSDGRFDLILGIIVRKLQMNMNLISVSSWGKVLLTSIFVFMVLLLKPRGMLRSWQDTRPYWMAGFTAIIVGSIVALALNDSGIVAAGTMIIFAAAPILLLISDQTARENLRRDRLEPRQ